MTRAVTVECRLRGWLDVQVLAEMAPADETHPAPYPVSLVVADPDGVIVPVSKEERELIIAALLLAYAEDVTAPQLDPASAWPFPATEESCG